MSTEGSRRRALEAVPLRFADTEPPGIRPLAGHKVEIIGAAFLAVKHIEATERQVELPSGGLARQTDTREQFSRFGDPDIDAADADEGLGTAGIAQKALRIARDFPVHQQRRHSAQFPAAAQKIGRASCRESACTSE